MGIKATRPGGADAGRGDDPHGTNDWQTPGKPQYNERMRVAKESGVPDAWVGKDLGISFSGKYLGSPSPGMASFSAESTGGGETDSHTISWTGGDPTAAYGTKTARMKAEKLEGGKLFWTAHPGDR